MEKQPPFEMVAAFPALQHLRIGFQPAESREDGRGPTGLLALDLVFPDLPWLLPLSE